MTYLIKYADYATIHVNVNKSSPDISHDTVDQYLEWSEENCMPCNVTIYNELCIRKRCKENYSHDIKQVESLKLLGITFQNNYRFTVHIKNKLLEANKCLFVIRSLHTGSVFTLLLNLSSLLFRNFFAVVTRESIFPIL